MPRHVRVSESPPLVQDQRSRESERMNGLQKRNTEMNSEINELHRTIDVLNSQLRSRNLLSILASMSGIINSVNLDLRPEDYAKFRILFVSQLDQLLSVHGEDQPPE